MRIHYDPQADALYIRFSEKSYAESDEIQEGVIMDKDEAGGLAGIELLNVSKKFPHLKPNEFKYEIAAVGEQE